MLAPGAEARRTGGLVAALAWLAFPAVPVVLEDVCQTAIGVVAPGDPRDWSWLIWVVQLGPLVGFAYLAGATLDLPDEPTGRRRPWGWLGRRGVWVAVGPWVGVLAWVGGLTLGEVAPAATAPVNWLAAAVHDRVPEPAWSWGLGTFVVVTFGYAWLVPAAAAFRRARRAGQGRAGASVARGVKVAVGFVASLFGSFWAVTEAWRSYFFDARVVPVVLIALSLLALEGCASTVTYGEVRRRELFQALLLAWVFGLALLWLWWSRTRKP